MRAAKAILLAVSLPACASTRGIDPRDMGAAGHDRAAAGETAHAVTSERIAENSGGCARSVRRLELHVIEQSPRLCTSCGFTSLAGAPVALCFRQTHAGWPLPSESAAGPLIAMANV